MRVRMLVGISGGRGDGTEWPARGGEIDVSDEEGADLCRARLAIPVAVAPVAETPERPAEVTTETRAAGPPAPAAAKADWVEYAVARLGLGRDEAAAMTKAQLIERVTGT